MTVFLSQWYSTFCFLADVDPIDTGYADAAHKAAHNNLPLPRPYGGGSFPIDSLNLWPWLVGNESHSPRTELLRESTALGRKIMLLAQK